MEKVQTEHYETNYEWRNRACFLIPGVLSILAAIKWAPTRSVTEQGDTLHPKAAGIIFGCLITLLGFGDLGFPWSSKTWQAEQVFSQDTHYQFSEFLPSTSVRVSSSAGERKTLKSDEKGNLAIDLRDFYGATPPDSDLILRINYGVALADEVKVPLGYVKKIKAYEDGAQSLFQRAQAEGAKMRYSEALSLYDEILSEYPYARVASQDKIKERKIALIKDQLQKVSEEKVRNAIDELGLSHYEADELAQKIISLSSSYSIAVMKNGLGLPLTDAECREQYQRLSLAQKFYAILCYKDYLGEDAIEELSSMLNISYTLAEKLVHINPQGLLGK